MTTIQGDETFECPWCPIEAFNNDDDLMAHMVGHQDVDDVVDHGGFLPGYDETDFWEVIDGGWEVPD